ncbi:ABC transporter ATP-binding protein [Oscillospiraceae bacterium MB08-C2-2]|nr:ABC transporter ATP-binding protein [Oscillospiraceae bacterium MB08-C2-2]
MIQTIGLTKKFGSVTALDDFSTTIKEGSIYGLVGSNGSGKSTLLRLISGIYRPDSGRVQLDGKDVFENPTVKNRIFLVSDDLYFLPQATMNDMAKFYSTLFSSYSAETYQNICSRFPIDANARINTFSKGMKRQVALILALACCPDVLLLDEAFDGLDPVIRILLRKMLADQISERNMSVVISSHNLRELEDLCDFMGLLHRGKIIFEREIDEVKLGFCKVQAGFRPMVEPEALDQLNILQKEQSGSVLNLIVRGNREDILAHMETLSPLFVETVPLTLEEVFVQEMEAVGYDYNKIIF